MAKPYQRSLPGRHIPKMQLASKFAGGGEFSSGGGMGWVGGMRLHRCRRRGSSVGPACPPRWQRRGQSVGQRGWRPRRGPGHPGRLAWRWRLRLHPGQSSPCAARGPPAAHGLFICCPEGSIKRGSASADWDRARRQRIFLESCTVMLLTE